MVKCYLWANKAEALTEYHSRTQAAARSGIRTESFHILRWCDDSKWMKDNSKYQEQLKIDFKKG